ncbi:MAG: hypothetical protein AB8G95_00040 [Anaerolineae bacterium]
MEYYGTLLTFHILGGGLALVSAVVAILSKVINSDHRWHVYSGRIYHYGMVVVFVTAFPMAILKPNLFLFLISIFSYYFVFTGWRTALNRKGTPHWIDWGVMGLMGVTSAGMLVYGIYLLIIGVGEGVTILVFGAIGAAQVWQDFQIIRRGGVKGRERIVMHLGKMMGGTIATVTAFVVVNISFQPAFVVWLAPTVLITPIIMWMSIQIRKKGRIVTGFSE